MWTNSRRSVSYRILTIDIDQIFRERAAAAGGRDPTKFDADDKQKEFSAFYSGDILGMEPYQSKLREKVSSPDRPEIHPLARLGHGLCSA